ncbi:31048e26-58af-45a7-a8bf-740dcd2c82b3 [Thermothielavioides terrestris]|uniref:Uncharacterized protein n=2 Tax=Thermothielavioides terrestris TaxID=2587410 RepID=G2R3M2_THETT|nr:uncharacterized protein THITE_2111791 [Thermothielavioides terrestris NRRL 8126]AEO65122.1 hypothetical protein THITE_2111791 [Thermothielavioides terrestris NRRL 8126]SPQ19622.1 31048e26-58af-45a7-a8bf-740dcd2c82b3 [Thermothielavioides terrestris]
MSKNGDITRFFKPVPVAKSSSSPQQLQASRRPASPAKNVNSTPTPPPRPPSPLPALLFSSSPPAPASTARDRNTEIPGSDDEDDDNLSSDDDFPSLFPAQPARKEASLYATPQAKRRALEFHASPLTINTRHKFDLQALLKHAEADNAIAEREQRTAALLAQGSPTALGARIADGAPASLHDTMLDVLSDPEDSQDEGHRRRLLRAVKRTEAAVHRKEWYFFDRQGQTNSTAIEVRPAFPRAKATGVWALLASERHRSEVFEDGLPFHVQTKMQSLPDAIFQWVLSEATRERSTKLRDEYVRLLGVCPDQIGRLIDENRIVELFQDLGASARALAPASQPSGASEEGAPYPELDRIRLQAVLRVLAETAHALRFQALTRTMAILLRLGIDNIVREDYAVMTDYQDALLQTALAVPPRSWNNFCEIVSDSLYHHTREAVLRWNAVSAIPLLHPRLIELRRRLALVFVFDDPRRASSPPEDTFSLRSVIDRLDQADEFVVDRKNTDYFELLALSEMLSVAVGDGAPPAGNASPEVIKQYNAEVDELAHRIKFMWSNIHEQGAAYMSRLEARVQLRDFERKLLHVVRTRPPPKEDIFGLNAREDEAERPKQQQFMKRFLSKNQPPPVTPSRGG